MQTESDITNEGAATRHTLYVANYGPRGATGGRLCDVRTNAPVVGPNRQPAPARRQAFPDPFAAFDAAVNGKTLYVSGYARKDGRKVAGYWRHPASRIAA